VAVNLFGSEKPHGRSLCGVECLDEIGERIETLLNVRVPDSLLGKLAMLPQLAEVAKFPPKAIGGKPPCQELVIPRAGRRSGAVSRAVCWRKTAGPISPSRRHHARPDDRRPQRRMYRIQVIGPRELAMHWQAVTRSGRRTGA